MTLIGPVKPSLTSFLEALRNAGGLRFEYTIATREADPETAQPPCTEVTLSGPDTSLLLERNGELLHALESLAATILRLEPEQAEQLSFDAAGFKAGREAAIAALAEEAIAAVRSSGKPYPFAPMNSRERRLLHLALVPSGLATASSGLGPRRFVVLYPEGHTPDPERFGQPLRKPDGNRTRTYPRQERPAGNQAGYRTADPNRQRASPGRSPKTANPSILPAMEPDPDSLGNRDDTNPASAPADTKPTTPARLDSIRRAFRKR